MLCGEVILHDTTHHVVDHPEPVIAQLVNAEFLHCSLLVDYE
jgi:hypothetical protein